MNFDTAIAEFLRVRRLGNYSQHTISNYGRDLSQFRAHVAGVLGREPEVAELTRDLVLNHLAECSRRLGRVSTDRHRYALKSFFQWIEDAAIGLNPMRGMNFPRHSYPKLPRFISPEQVGAIIRVEAIPELRGAHIRHHHALELRDRAMIEVFFGSACRVSEVICLDWRDWRLQAPGELFIRSGKGGDDRIALIGEPAIDALEAWSRAAWVGDLGAPIFQTPRGERITVRAAEKMVTLRARRAGIEEAVTPHYFRHSAATAMMQAGAGIADIGALLGHKNLNTTTKYTHIDIGYLRKQIAFHPRETASVRQQINVRATVVHLTEPKEKPMHSELMDSEFWDKAPKHDRLTRFENDRRATVRAIRESQDEELENYSTPLTLRFFATACAPDESHQLLSLATKYDDLFAQLREVNAEVSALVARIGFAGASSCEVKEARRELKSLRKLAA